ncbi:hypothetical protein Taro_027113 [Colocasia esculenta]|uniref:Uncharacterized protein n=1 Tax=Colocasia esculenta TaxID=4460 RepID=A0A843VD52_COLES|nr:hypothetical protein [Colocasia esculenta]
MDDDQGPPGGSKKRVKPTVGIRGPAAAAGPPACRMRSDGRYENSAASHDLVAMGEGGGSGVEEEVLEAEVGAVITCSEEMEVRISQMFEKIDHFTQQVADMLEEGKTMFKNLSAEFEERLIAIHREQIDKWEEEIRELRLLDASNEAARALLQKAQYHLLQNVQMET